MTTSVPAGGGETVSASSHGIFAGGKGLNQSLAAAAAGAAVTHFGCVGDDGQFLIDELSKAGVAVGGIRRVAGETSGHAVIQVNERGENAIVITGAANRRLTPDDLDQAFSELQPDDTLSDDFDDRLDDIPGRMADDVAPPPVNDPRTSPGDECLSPSDLCCQSAINTVRRFELRGIRFSDDAGGEFIRSTGAEFPVCFEGFVFADNQTCSPETGLFEDIQNRPRTP